MVSTTKGAKLSGTASQFRSILAPLTANAYIIYIYFCLFIKPVYLLLYKNYMFCRLILKLFYVFFLQPFFILYVYCIPCDELVLLKNTSLYFHSLYSCCMSCLPLSDVPFSDERKITCLYEGVGDLLRIMGCLRVVFFPL